MTWKEARIKTLQLLDQYSNGGALIGADDGNTMDFTLKFPEYFDTLQKEVATTNGRIAAVEHISVLPIPNLMGGDTFTEVQHWDTDLTDMVGIGAKSYYFEVDNPSNHTIEEETAPDIWTTLTTVLHPGIGAFTAYRGLITAADAAHSIRIRHSGSYPFQVRNRALYGYTFPSAGDVPEWKPKTEHTMPTAFWRMSKALDSDGSQVPFEDRGGTKIAFDRAYTGGIDLYYWAMPATIPDNVVDSYLFEVPEEAAQALPFGVASMAMRNDLNMFDVANVLYSQYQGKVAGLQSKPQLGAQSVKNTFFGSSRSGRTGSLKNMIRG